MEPETRQDAILRFCKYCPDIVGHDFTVIGLWLFEKNGIVYELSCADLSQLAKIEREGLFVVN